jgi:hypothetical protein
MGLRWMSEGSLVVKEDYIGIKYTMEKIDEENKIKLPDALVK